jgi:hypothetical protein
MTARTFHLPSDPLTRFLEVYETARDTGRWYEKQSNSLRHACLALVTMEGRPTELVRRLRRTAGELKSRSGMFSPMQNAMRYVYAAHLLAIGVSPERIILESTKLKEMLRSEKLPRHTTAYNVVTALVLLELSLERGGSARITRDQVGRMAQVYRAFKDDHPWITGGDDLAPAALLSGEAGAPRAIASRVETIYQELRSHKYGRLDLPGLPRAGSVDDGVRLRRGRGADLRGHTCERGRGPRARPPRVGQGAPLGPRQERDLQRRGVDHDARPARRRCQPR